MDYISIFAISGPKTRLKSLQYEAGSSPALSISFRQAMSGHAFATRFLEIRSACGENLILCFSRNDNHLFVKPPGTFRDINLVLRLLLSEGLNSLSGVSPLQRHIL